MAKRGPKIADKYMTATAGVDYKSDSWEPDYSGVTIAFRGGKTLSARLDEIPAELHPQLACHGLSQKLGDSYAGVMGDVELAWVQSNNVLQLLKRGEWEKEGRETNLDDLEEAVNTYRRELGKTDYSHDEFMSTYTGPGNSEKRERAKAHGRVAAIMTAIAQRKLAERKAKLDAEAATAARDDTI